jgi:hypothetical protein
VLKLFYAHGLGLRVIVILRHIKDLDIIIIYENFILSLCSQY